MKPIEQLSAEAIAKEASLGKLKSYQQTETALVLNFEKGVATFDLSEFNALKGIELKAPPAAEDPH